MKAPEVKNRKNAKNALFLTFDPKINFWAQNHFLSILSLFEHFCAFLLKMTKNGFTRAYET